MEDILDAQAAGLVTIDHPGVVVLCPVISEKGAEVTGNDELSEEFPPFPVTFKLDRRFPLSEPLSCFEGLPEPSGARCSRSYPDFCGQIDLTGGYFITTPIQQVEWVRNLKTGETPTFA